MHVQRQKPGARVYVVGTQSLENEFRDRGFMLTDDAPDFAVLGFDTTLTYAKLWKLCDLVRAGVRYIATHPDYNCPTETGFMPDVGAMISFVKASTGRQPDLIMGKPNSLFVEHAAERLGIPVSAMCMIGDRLYTDIALGATAGIPTILVLSGETRAHEVAGSPYQPSYIFQDIQAVPKAPVYPFRHKVLLGILAGAWNLERNVLDPLDTEPIKHQSHSLIYFFVRMADRCILRYKVDVVYLVRLNHFQFFINQ
jgi:ribonucleotide monophosphatase NagD (HAD superfamily)